MAGSPGGPHLGGAHTCLSSVCLDQALAYLAQTLLSWCAEAMPWAEGMQVQGCLHLWLLAGPPWA